MPRIPADEMKEINAQLPGLLKAYRAMGEALFTEGNLDAPLQEKLAIQFAELLITWPESITDAFYKELGLHFSQVQIVPPQGHNPAVNPTCSSPGRPR